jgi:hypothetical protein
LRKKVPVSAFKIDEWQRSQSRVKIVQRPRKLRGGRTVQLAVQLTVQLAVQQAVQQDVQQAVKLSTTSVCFA